MRKTFAGAMHGGLTLVPEGESWRRSAISPTQRLGRLFILLALAAGFTWQVRAELRLGTPFQDHAVLQRDRPLPVWGWARPGEPVRVTLGAGEEVSTRAGVDGRWQVTLPARPASATPLELTAEGGTQVVARDILIGEVWLCSGQSNMEWRLRFAADATVDIAAADLPQIRQLKVARYPRAERQEEAPAKWSVCSPASAGDFSAVGFHFARRLWGALRVPVGLINCSHGNSPVEGWMSAETLAGDPAFKPVTDRWAEVLARYPAAQAKHTEALRRWEEKAATERQSGRTPPAPPAAPIGPNHQQEPSALFNGMIAPVRPFAVRGFLWYQGEGNARRAAEYEKLFGALIGQWRKDFLVPEAPFLWVQLPGLDRMPPTTTREDWIALREAQTANLALPATGQAIKIDVGDPADIHPVRKREVGERLARLALHRVHGEPVLDRGPELVRASAARGVIALEFEHTGGGLRLGGESVPAFEAAGADGVFIEAARVEILDGTRLRVHVPSIERPKVVRHAWRAYPRSWLINAEGLPAPPFSRAVP
ncbi:MAG: sialate O-acetylesterase [Opitutaceae bacterium]